MFYFDTKRGDCSTKSEVRVGDTVWNDIKFDVSLDAATYKARKVAYKIEK